MKAQQALAAFVSERTGIELTRGGIDGALQRFVARRQKELALTPKTYLELVTQAQSPELERLVNAITVGYTWFFRDPGQFAAVEALLASDLGGRSKLRIWIPACSTGEDAYSIACLAERSGRSVEILATDLNSRSLEQARRGVYRSWSVRDLDPRFVANFTRNSDGSFEVQPQLRERVTFAKQNLIERPPVPSDAATWDIIFCRNVLIYFERSVALGVLENLTRALSTEGHLVLGASEVICEVPPGLHACYVAGRLAFRRADSLPEHPPTLPRTDKLHAAWPLSILSAAGVARTEVTPPPPVEAISELEHDLAAGHRRIETGDVTGARHSYLQALERDPTRADARMYVGIARYLCGEIEPALHELRAALFLDDGLWPAAFYLALCHESSGHPAEALQAFQHVVRLYATATSSLGCIFDVWRHDLCELARRRVGAVISVAKAGVLERALPTWGA